MIQIDEETPLLQENNGKKRPTPLPWFQFSIVLFLQLAEPLTSQVIYPFAPQVCVLERVLVVTRPTKTSVQLIRDLGITNGNESQVGYYVGLMVRGVEISGAASSLTSSNSSNHYSF